MTKYPLTLLAPAKDAQTGMAAIRAGADAVYIGAPKFGARQAAGNSIEDIRSLVEYAHLYGVQVLVTLNTLLTDEERHEAVQIARQLYEAGVDALIIQDLRLLSEDLPPIRLHASTQCDNRSVERVKTLEELGFRRVVLARELSIEEIRSIRQQTDVELEVFVHGALCVSYSGCCYMSERLLGRSANRGACAQMCRMRYDLLDGEGREIRDDRGQAIHQRYLLSLQDMDRSQSLGELIEAGATTFKIEGRLKDADYVTNVVAYYRTLLDKYMCEHGMQEEVERRVLTRTFSPNPEKTFHRGGTDYFLHERNSHLTNWDTPKSTGEYIGTVLQDSRNAAQGIRVQVQEGVILHNGDGVSFGDKGFSINRVEGGTIYPNSLPEPIQRGTRLYRNLDIEFTRSLHTERRIVVDIVLSETEDGYRLQMQTVGKMPVMAEECFAVDKQPAKNVERAQETIRQQLAKLGDSVYQARSVTIETEVMPFLPISTLNSWRRSVSEALDHALRAESRHRVEHTPISTEAIPTLPKADEQPLMTCRYCLLHEMGHCRKRNPLQNEPKAIRLQNGTTMRLEFDCKNCRMLIL